MVNDNDTHSREKTSVSEPTRRDVLKASGVATGAAMFGVSSVKRL